MRTLRAAILHRHVLFRDLIEHELQELGPTEIAATTSDPETALELVREQRLDALIVESSEGFLGRPQIVELFCRAVAESREFVLIAANLATSEVEVLQDRISERAHLGGLRPILHGASS